MEAETITLILALTPLQRAAVDATFEAFAAARDRAMEVGREAGTAGCTVLQRLCYPELRARYGLGANLAVRAIGQAAYRLKEPSVAYRSGGDTIDYDARIFSFDRTAERLSLATVDGRLRWIPVVLEANERRRLRSGHASKAVLHRTGRGVYRFVVTLTAAGPGGGAA